MTTTRPSIKHPFWLMSRKRLDSRTIQMVESTNCQTDKMEEWKWLSIAPVTRFCSPRFYSLFPSLFDFVFSLSFSLSHSLYLFLSFSSSLFILSVPCRRCSPSSCDADDAGVSDWSKYLKTRANSLWFVIDSKDCRNTTHERNPSPSPLPHQKKKIKYEY